MITHRWVHDYSDGICVVSPDAPEDWADGFGNAHVHLEQNRLYVHDDDMDNPDYRDGYLTGALFYLTAEKTPDTGSQGECYDGTGACGLPDCPVCAP